MVQRSNHDCVCLSGPFGRIISSALIIGRLVTILREIRGPQICYQIVFCFWLISFDQVVAEQIDRCVSQRRIKAKYSWHDL